MKKDAVSAPFDGSVGPSKTEAKVSSRAGSPTVSILPTGMFVFNRQAVEAFDLKNRNIVLHYIPETSGIAISVSETKGEGKSPAGKNIVVRRSEGKMSDKKFLTRYGVLPSGKRKFKLNIRGNPLDTAQLFYLSPQSGSHA